MTLLSKITNSRQLFLSTAGAALLLPGMMGETSQAQQNGAPRVLQAEQQEARPIGNVALTAGTRRNERVQARSPVQQELQRLYEQNNQEQPNMVDPGYSARPQGQSNATPAQPTGKRQQTVTPVAQSNSRPAPIPQPQPSLVDRLFGGFRSKRGPTAPPQDPGMDYKTVSQAEAEAKNFNPNNSFIPPPNSLLPGQSEPSNIAALPPAAPPAQLKAPAAASPIGLPAIAGGNTLTPLSPGDDFLIPRMGDADQPQITANSTEIPKLKELLNAQEAATPAETVVAQVDAPFANENVALDDLEQEPSMGNSDSADPFSDLFPEDTTSGKQLMVNSVSVPKQKVATVEETFDVEEVEEEIQQPYTGMKLEEDLFLNTGLPSNLHPLAEESIAELPSEKPATVLIPETVLKPEMALKSETTKNPEPETQMASRNSLVAPGHMPQLQSPEKSSVQQTKMELIAAREGKSGLKGFCCVMLRDKRSLVDGISQFSATHQGKRYQLSSEEALVAFLSDPSKYAPASKGNDVIHEALTGEELEGSLDHAVWYKGKLYLFASEETKETFVAAPSNHSSDK